MYENKFENINFFVGINGSGKSRYLNKLVKFYKNYQYNVLGISNTVFDKISNNCKKMSANRGRYFFKKIIFDVLVDDIHGDRESNRVNDFFNILDYLNYDMEIRFSFKFPKGVNNKRSLYDYLVNNIDSDNYSKKLEEIENIYHIFVDHSYYDHKNGFLIDYSYWDNLEKNNNFYSALKLYRFISENKLGKTNILFLKNGKIFSLEGASSGESHFLANMLFLYRYMNSNKKNIILVDEPEISLHPKWQRDYVFKLYDFFYKYDCQFFLATHSPLIISKVQSSKKDLYDDYIQNVQYKIFNVKDEELEEIYEDDDYSIESLYWEVFGILTPNNSFLSRFCVDLLDRYDREEISLNEIQSEFESLKEASDLRVQKDTLSQIESEYLLRGKYYD